MNRNFLIASAIMLIAGSASAETLRWEPGSKVEKALVREELSIEPTATVSAIRLDLNNDGKPETILKVQGASFCGSRGCQIEIFSSDKKRIGSLLGNEIEAVDPVTRGYRSLRLDKKAVLTWNGQQYLPQK